MRGQVGFRESRARDRRRSMLHAVAVATRADLDRRRPPGCSCSRSPAGCGARRASFGGVAQHDARRPARSSMSHRAGRAHRSAASRSCITPSTIVGDGSSRQRRASPGRRRAGPAAADRGRAAPSAATWRSMISRNSPRLLRRDRRVQQRLDVAADRRQRRAQFVRDVGDEVAAHLIGAAQVGDVAQHQHGAAAARARRPARRAPRTSGAAGVELHFDRRAGRSPASARGHQAAMSGWRTSSR